MITIQHEGSLTIVGVFGELDTSDFRQMEAEIGAQLAKSGKVNLLVDLRDMIDATAAAAFEEFRFNLKHSGDVGRIAIVSDSDAVAWNALLARLFLKAEIQVFDTEDAARDWLG